MTKHWLSTTRTAVAFNVSTATVMRWRTMKGFPEDAVRAAGATTTLYQIDKVAAWLKCPPPARRRPYKWRVDAVAACKSASSK